jgi:heme/copper-type cytochrome/quinol oxidase subunit 1
MGRQTTANAAKAPSPPASRTNVSALLGAPRRTPEVGYSGAAAAQSWEPPTILAAAGGFFLFASIVTLVAAAAGTLRQNQQTEPMEAVFAMAADPGDRTPAPLQHPYRWGVAALVSAALAYAGPLGELLRNPGYLAPGMRTW